MININIHHFHHEKVGVKLLVKATTCICIFVYFCFYFCVYIFVNWCLYFCICVGHQHLHHAKVGAS